MVFKIANMISFVDLILFAVMVSERQSNAMDIPGRACDVYYKAGDVVIGGIFPIFLSYPNKPCERYQSLSVTTSAEILAYTVDAINKQDDLLSNITLGFEIRNDCSYEELTLWTVTTMTSLTGSAEYLVKCPNHTRGHVDRVIAVIGPSRSTTGLLAAKAGGLSDTPVISYAATSDELSDSNRFPYFFRTVPPDKFQVGAIMDILLYFNWKYIALFYSVDTYGINAARQIQMQANEIGICIPVTLPVASAATERDLEDIRNKLDEHDKVHVVVIFALRSASYAVADAIGGLGRRFTIIGSDGVGLTHSVDHMHIAQGGLFIDLFNTRDPQWHQYLAQLPSSTGFVSQWYETMARSIMAKYNCSTWASCNVPNPYMGTEVVNGAFAVAHALNASITKYCDSPKLCEKALEGESIREELTMVQFPSLDGRLFQFDANGDASGKYVIRNMKDIDGQISRVTVGYWDPNEETLKSRLVLDETIIQWVNNESIPKSLCEEECTVGQIVVPSEKQCCKRCQQCPEYSITVKSQCVDCSRLEWPNENFTTCVPCTNLSFFLKMD